MNCLKIYPIKTIIILFSLLVIILGRGDYLFYHFVLKMISIIIFFTIFFVGWNSREFTGEHSFLFIAIACMIIGLFDIFHMITYNGTVFFDYIVPNIHSKLWVAARLTESFSLLIALLILKYHKFINIDLVFSIYFLLTMIILFDILYYQKIFPVCFVEGRGFTRFRICSECLIILTFLFSIYLIVKEKGLLHPQLRQLALISLSLSVIAEVFISLNAYNPYNFTHMLGQIFKVLALVYLFRALVEEVLKKPYRNLFQQHNYSQHKLIVSASFLSTMVHDLKNPLANIRALCQLSKIAKTEEKERLILIK